MITAPAAVDFDSSNHSYRLDGAPLPSVTQILGAVGLSTDWDRMPPAVRAAAEAKREIGSAVHEACALCDAGSLSWGSLDDAVFGYVEAWERYVRQRGIVEWLLVETPLAHPVLRYAGTPDRVGRTLAGELVLVDVKCGDPDDAGGQFQTAGYALLVEQAGIATVRVLQRECVQLFPAGTFALSPYRDYRNDTAVFKAAVTVAHAQPRRKR